MHLHLPVGPMQNPCSKVGRQERLPEWCCRLEQTAVSSLFCTSGWRWTRQPGLLQPAPCLTGERGGDIVARVKQMLAMHGWLGVTV